MKEVFHTAPAYCSCMNFAGTAVDSNYSCAVKVYRLAEDNEQQVPEYSDYVFRFYLIRNNSSYKRPQHYWAYWVNLNGSYLSHNDSFLWPSNGSLTMTVNTLYEVFSVTARLKNDSKTHTLYAKAGCNNTTPTNCIVNFSFHTALYVAPVVIPGTPTLTSDFDTIAMNSVELNWSAVDNAEYYELEIAITDLSDNSVTDSFLVSDNSFTLNTELGYNYAVRVCGVNSNGEAGEWSNVITINNCGTVKVKQGGSFKNATPYVKTDQGWKKTAAYIKNDAGVWVPAKTR